MLKNYVTDTDLKKFHPKIANQLWSEQQDYSSQIATAFGMLLNELHNRGINPRLCMTPLDLVRPSSATVSPFVLYSLAISATSTGDAILAGNERRFAINISAIAGGALSVVIQGSNLASTPTPTDATWETIATLSASATGEKTTVFTNQYRWYRYVATPANGVTATFTAYVHDVIFDDVICYGALILIFTDLTIENGDMWSVRLSNAQQAYSGALDSIKFSYDRDDDGVPEVLLDETGTSSLEMKR